VLLFSRGGGDILTYRSGYERNREELWQWGLLAAAVFGWRGGAVGFLACERAGSAACEEGVAPQKLMVPVRDGVKLATDLYFPSGKGPWPVILVRTPYNRRLSFMFQPFLFYPEAGFALAVQDGRGRFESEGVYRPFLDDMEDGHDTVEWLAAQEWSTGKIGMTGDSAMGIVAYAAAMGQPPHLKAAAVFCARNPCPVLTRFPGGLFLENGVSSTNETVGIANQAAKVPHIAEMGADDIRVDLRRY
jgi:predicted acyl esterase